MKYYNYCAKGGHPKAGIVTGWVCENHHRTEGLYTHCANCGKPMDNESRNYVCWNCLVHKP